MGKKKVRHCVKCGQSHEKPTGLKCNKLEAETFQDPGAPGDDDPELLGAVGGQADVNNNPHDDQGSRFDEDRLFAMEDLVKRMAKVVLLNSEERPSRTRAAISRSSSSDDSSRSVSPKGRAPRSQRKLISQTRHVNPGETLTSFDSLMVITFKTMIELQENQLPINGILNHGLVMAEKAASGAYMDRASINYDASVRQRASKFGLGVFENPCNEDLIRHYSLENSKKFGAGQGSSYKKKKNLCYRFNSEAGCHAKDCGFAHKCSICKLEGHSMRTCMSKDKSQK